MSLGDREISRSSPLPVVEQPFRDRSNTLSEKPALPVIRDKYKDLTGEVEVRSCVEHKSMGTDVHQRDSEGVLYPSSRGL